MPLEVHPLATRSVIRHLGRCALQCPADKLAIRQGGAAKAGPCVTDNGNFIIDAQFDERWMRDPAALNGELLAIPGIVCVGSIYVMDCVD